MQPTVISLFPFQHCTCRARRKCPLWHAHNLTAFIQWSRCEAARRAWFPRLDRSCQAACRVGREQHRSHAGLPAPQGQFPGSPLRPAAPPDVTAASQEAGHWRALVWGAGVNWPPYFPSSGGSGLGGFGRYPSDRRKLWLARRSICSLVEGFLIIAALQPTSY